MMNDLGPKLVTTPEGSFEIVEADGSTSVRILTPIKDANDSYRIRRYTSSQEIYDATTGKTVARTTDPEMATHICKLLIVWEKLQKKASSPDAAKEQK